MTPVVRKRLISGVILAAAGVGALYLPSWGIGLILPLLVALTQLEFYSLFDRAGIPVFRTAGVLSGAVLVCGTWLAYAMGGGPRLAGDVELFLIFLMLATAFFCQLPRKHDPAPLVTMACTLLGILYVPFMFNFFVKLAYTWDAPALDQAFGPTGRRLFVYFLAVVKLTDVGAYTFGSIFGRHKLLPRISPGKTVEGVAGGWLTGALASVACWALWQGSFGAVQLSLPVALFIGAVLPLAGVLGDLVESMLKRAAGAKDSSCCFPGLGGLLDVLDSLFFAAPVLYLILRCVV